MKKQRFYVDRPQTTAMKQLISRNNIQNILPYELMIQAINLQNRQLYSLQQKYLKLVQQTKQAKDRSQFEQNQKHILKARQERKICERKLFVEQGLKANSMKYHQGFLRQKNLQIQILQMKREMLKSMKGHSVNMFFNLGEGILDELIQYARHSEKLQEGRKLELIDEIKVWKKRYQAEILNNDSTQGTSVL